MGRFPSNQCQNVSMLGFADKSCLSQHHSPLACSAPAASDTSSSISIWQACFHMASVGLISCLLGRPGDDGETSPGSGAVPMVHGRTITAEQHLPGGAQADPACSYQPYGAPPRLRTSPSSAGILPLKWEEFHQKTGIPLPSLPDFPQYQTKHFKCCYEDKPSFNCNLF